MVSRKRILGIIPARGGSKGIPRKNLSDVCGKPLIARTIETGIELTNLGVLSRCIVSTDDTEIADISIALGAEVPFMRPASAATDTAKASDYVVHALDTLEQNSDFYDAFMILQPTSPCRDALAIRSSVEQFLGSDADSLISCYREEYINDLVMYKSENGRRLKPCNSNHNKGIRRQDHGATMVRNGSLYVTKVPYFRSTGLLVCDRPALMEMSKLDSIDVDTFDDLTLLRAVLCK